MSFEMLGSVDRVKRITWVDNGGGAWQPQDKAFMQQRRKDWNNVKQSLLLLTTFISKSRHKQHREFFMTGDIVDSYDENKFFYGYSLSKNEATLLFQMWYYPENDLDYFSSLFDAAHITDINASRMEFKNYCRSPGGNDLDPEYGLMGGREENIFRALYPSYDPKETKEYENGSSLRMASDAHQVANAITSAYNPRFCGYLGNVHAHGQYIWDYLEYFLENTAPDDLKYSSLFYKMLHTAKYREKSERRFPVDNPSVVSLADGLQHKFENREFCDGLLDIWDNIDELYKQYLRDYKS